jgi:4'-phosphopantetheinyl transferase
MPVEVDGRMMTAQRDETAPGSTRATAVATVDVWRAHLKLQPGQLSALARCLDEEEQARAARFHFQRDMVRFRASRGLLRHILARYLDMPPERIRFGYAPMGKPFLLEHPGLHFNLSHAEDVLLVAVAHGRRVGVDVERAFSEVVMDDVSRMVLSHPERVALGRVAQEERLDWFTRLWTRKEAYIKADGQGMSLRLNHIDVSTRSGRVRLQGTRPEDWYLSPQWVVRAIPVGSGYTAALAAEGFDWQFTCVDWPSDARWEHDPSQPADRRQS